VTRIEIVRQALDAVGARRYLELGVKDGVCFRAIEAETKVAVDPHFAFRVPLGSRLRTLLGKTEGVLHFGTTSDVFFDRHATRLAPFDVVFVDGLHTYEQAYRDVVNALGVLRPGGLVVVHDCNPQSAAAAVPSLAEAARTEGFAGDWNGDVYRAIVRLRTDPRLRVDVVDADQGVGLVSAGTAETRLELELEEIERLGYEQLDRDRVQLLGLRPPDDLAELLAAHAAH